MTEIQERQKLLFIHHIEKIQKGDKPDSVTDSYLITFTDDNGKPTISKLLSLCWVGEKSIYDGVTYYTINFEE